MIFVIYLIRLMKHKASADYKALRGAAILARYQEKEARCHVETADEEQMAEFDELFGVMDVTTNKCDG